jgi:hypothetical protein
MSGVGRPDDFDDGFHCGMHCSFHQFLSIFNSDYRVVPFFGSNTCQSFAIFLVPTPASH